MTLPASGAISLRDVNVELGLSATAQISLNDAGVRGLLGKSSGTISLNDGYGKSNISYLSGTGGTVTYSGGYKIHTFTGTGTFSVSSIGNQGATVEYLIVAGGGSTAGGYGGAGGLLKGSFTASAQNYTITVGGGGTGTSGESTKGTNGNNSSISGIATAIGGGAGGASNSLGGNGGGSGGAGYSSGGGGGAGTSGQGNPGGTGSDDEDGTYSGNPGGAVSRPSSDTSNVWRDRQYVGTTGFPTDSFIGGRGGVYYAGTFLPDFAFGDWGFNSYSVTNIFPSNAGWPGTSVESGNFAGFGGSSNNPRSGNMGIVIVRYKYNSDFIVATGGTVTTDGNDKIHTFNGTGTFTVTSAPSNAYISYLIVAGGGGGGQYRGVIPSYRYSIGGGGGAGGRLFGSTTVTTQDYTISIGGGGGVEGGGGATTAFGLTAYGGGTGGYGGNGDVYNVTSGYGGDGGSGGGSGHCGTSNTFPPRGGYGTSGQGTNGFWQGKGGSYPIVTSISGTPTGYADGGTAGDNNGNARWGAAYKLGSYIGFAYNALTNTGGGGSGGYNYNNTNYVSGTNGGSGVVIIRYPYQ
jgi:hypothetical protein